MRDPLPRRTNRATFDKLFAEGATAVAAGSHGRQEAPHAGNLRWGMSALLRPDPGAAAKLEVLAGEAAAVAGAGHWLTGSVATSHLTMWAMEYPRDDIPEDDPCVARYAGRAARGSFRCRTPEVRRRGADADPAVGDGLRAAGR